MTIREVWDNIHISDGYAVYTIDERDFEPDAVVSLSKDAFDVTTYHEHLYDGSNDYQVFEKVMDDVIDIVENNETVLIHCNAGISRSAAVITTLVSYYTGKRFEEALKIVEDAKNDVNPHPELRKLGKEYLERNTDNQ